MFYVNADVRLMVKNANQNKNGVTISINVGAKTATFPHMLGNPACVLVSEMKIARLVNI